MSDRAPTGNYEVRTSDDHVVQWDRENIIHQILRDTSLCQKFYGHPPATREIAEHIAIDVEQKLAALDTSYLTSHLIRELVCISLLEHGYHAYRNMCTRVGTPVYDAHMIDIGGGFESNDNANLQGNPETSHKKKADKISKEQYLLQLPPHIAEAHLRSDIHIHDLEYFGTRPFCMAKNTVVIAQAPDNTLKFGTVGAIFGEFAFEQGGGCDLADGSGYRVLTPTGFVPITSISRRVSSTMCRVSTASGMFVDLTPEHRVILRYPAGRVKRTTVADLQDGDAIGRIEFAPPVLTDRTTTTEINGVTITQDIAVLIGRYCRGFEDCRGFEADETVISDLLDILHVHRDEVNGRYLPDWVLQVPDTLIQCMLHGMGIDLMQDRDLIDKITAIPSPILRQQVRCLVETLPLCDWDCTSIVGRVARVQQIDTLVYDDFVYDFSLATVHMFYAGSGLLISNCQDWDLRYFFYYGLMPDGSGTKASVSAFANRPEVAVLHAVKVLGSAQTNFAGGQGYYNFLTFLAPYFEGMPYAEIKQMMQMFVYEMTQMMVARGGQLVFASVQLSPGVPTLWKDKPVVYKGRVWDGEQAPHRTYGEFEQEVRLAFKAMMDVMMEGDYWGKPFNFPKPEVSLEPDFMTEDEAYNAAHPDLPTYRELYDMAFELAAKFGTPYFDNQIPAYRGAGKGISCYQCCMPGFVRIPVMTKFGIRIIRLDQLRRDYQVMTPDGFKGFEDILVRDFKGDLIRFRFDDGRHFLCTDDHRIPIIRNTRLVVIPASEVVVGDEIPFRPVDTDEVVDAYPYEKTVTVTKIGGEPFRGKVYDPVNVDGHLFYTADGLLTSNCAYQFGASPESDPEFFDKLYFRNGAHFSMGAGQVVTLNCPRAAYEAGHDVKKLVARLKSMMDIAAEIFVTKQQWMQEIVTHNRIPFALQRPRDPITGELGAVAVDLPGLVYTVGIVGINEMVQHLTGSQLHESKDAVKAAVYVLVELNKYARDLTERHGFTIAMARTPAETTGQRFAVADLLSDRYRVAARMVVKGDLAAFDQDVGTTRDLPVYYNNGTHVPVDAPMSIYDKIRVEEIFFTLVQGGNIFHAFLGETMPDSHGLAEFGLNIAKKTQIGYFAFTRDLSIPLRRYRRYGGPV